MIIKFDIKEMWNMYKFLQAKFESKNKKKFMTHQN